MIVLDEQLLGREIEREIAKWYRGAVQFITDLRPNPVIKDDAIPVLLRQQNQPTFVTINEKDFWQKVIIDNRYCVICFALPDSRAIEIPTSLRSVFRYPEFRTKAKRMGKVIRVTAEAIYYYTLHETQVKAIPLEPNS
jgi:hypothetical protein